MNPTIEKKPTINSISEIIIHWAESILVPINDLSYSADAANEIVNLIAMDMGSKDLGSCCKLKYTAKWFDGLSWTGRLDITKEHIGVNSVIFKDIYEKASYEAGLLKPVYMTNEEYESYLKMDGITSERQNELKKFLVMYELL